VAVEPLELVLQSLTSDAFREFGQVIQLGAGEEVMPINYGLTERHHGLAKIDVETQGGHGIINIFRSEPIELPFQIKVMERHPLGSQAFMPLSGNPYIVVVAPPGDFEPSAMRAFLAEHNQGVNYARGTWHHYCLALHAISDFLVVDRVGAGDNCDEIDLPPAMQRTIATWSKG
jgi:ureidoglycolate lyase